MKLTEYKSESLGTIHIKSMRLSDRQQVFSLAKEHGDHFLAPATLSVCIVAKDGTPLKTIDEWDEYGEEHYSECIAMYLKAVEVNDIGGAQATKKSKSPKS